MTKNGFVAIVGRPNVGKSSLLNALLGEKIAIVSDKPQTTRTRITGVLTKGETQLVFIDTPGLHKPKTKLSQQMVRQVTDSVADVDVAVLVTEAQGPITKAELDLIDTFSRQKLPAIVALNKIDLLDRPDKMLEKIQKLSELYSFDHIVPISVLTGEGIDSMMTCVEGYVQEGPHFFEDDTLTDQPERVIVAEIIREKILNNMQQEIPHGTAVAIESMKEREDRDLMDIDAIIFCERMSHKGMLIGKKGQMLKTIATEAREDIQRFLGIQVHLQCWVKVREDWRNRESAIRQFGLES